MKTINKKIKLWICFVLAIATVSCELEEEPFSLYSPETFYSNESEVLAAMSGVYRQLAAPHREGAVFRVFELPADLWVVHAKIQGWWETPNIQQLNDHTWDAGHRWVRIAYNNVLFNIVGQTNSVIPSFENSGLELDGPIAEMRASRALAYFYLMDGWGNVPVFTEPVVDPNNLPEQTPRAEVFDFVVSEFELAAQDLPSKADVSADYYGRWTQEAVYGFLATIYLNAEVYTGTAQYGRAAEYADLVINSGSYSLLSDYFANFSYDNEFNDEQLLSGVMTPNEPGGLGQQMVIKANFGIIGLFGLPTTPQNGMAARPALYDRYEATDLRRSMFFYYGNLVDPATGEDVMVERVVEDNNSTLFDAETSTEGPVPFNVIPATGLTGQPMNAGIKFIKWGLDPNPNGNDATNDLAYLRYADILLTKAEAILRGGGSGDPTDLVNQVRTRSGATPLTSVTLDDVLDERARELCFEGLGIRRRDLVRYNRLTGDWPFKDPASIGDSKRNLFPIPTEALDANPNLVQNTGY